MTTRVVHVRDPHDMYIGRLMRRQRIKGSKWQNPYRVGRDGTREQVLDKYRNYILATPDLLAALPELRGKVLACWCRPLACHGDVLAELADA